MPNKTEVTRQNVVALISRLKGIPEDQLTDDTQVGFIGLAGAVAGTFWKTVYVQNVNNFTLRDLLTVLECPE